MFEVGWYDWADREQNLARLKSIFTRVELLDKVRDIHNAFFHINNNNTHPPVSSPPPASQTNTRGSSSAAGERLRKNVPNTGVVPMPHTTLEKVVDSSLPDIM